MSDTEKSLNQLDFFCTSGAVQTQTVRTCTGECVQYTGTEFIDGGALDVSDWALSSEFPDYTVHVPLLTLPLQVVW